VNQCGISFTTVGIAQVTHRALPDNDLRDDEILLETEYSTFSTGMEARPAAGGSVGIVRKTGSRVSGATPGDRVYCWGGHNDIAITRGLMVKVPAGIDPRHAALVGRAGEVAFSAHRVSGARTGDTVAVVGMGLAGNLAAQIMRANGCRVIGLDVSNTRLEVARACGIADLIHLREDNPVHTVRRLTGGAMCQAVMEACDMPSMAPVVSQLAARSGKVIALGGNRPKEVNKHALQRSIRRLFEMMKSGAIRAEPLLTHYVAPSICQQIYTHLLDRDEDYFGITFDWTKR
jgi:D-arabinose 1-dehydrogenase-like Zn-dependent alcohol dehydrogenase